MLSRADAEKWLDRWDQQQQTYIADREERFSVITDVLKAAIPRSDPRIVDLGIGPGSLAIRLLDRIPAARVVGVDAGPLLAGLARAAYGHNPRLRLSNMICGLPAGTRHSTWTGHRTLSSAPRHCTG